MIERKKEQELTGAAALLGFKPALGWDLVKQASHPRPLDVTLRYAKVNVSCQDSSDRRLQFSLRGSPRFCLWSLSLWAEATGLVTGRE